jgi:asparagine synthase (glutamine-hydrolysing)
MCGIIGAVAWEDRWRLTREDLLRMTGKIAHRGPDGERIWESASAPWCGLGFRRLAILDLDARAMQPMTDGRRWLVFNGEIYNFRELRNEIDSLRPGYAWKTTGDSEVILRAYDCWGEHCVNHLNGMFALVIWDPQEKALFLARDRMGQKPLYFALAPGGGGAAFASELAAIMQAPWISRDVDGGNLVEYLRLGYVPRGSIYKQVDSVAPGEIVTIGREMTRRKYFDANAMVKNTGDSPVRTARELVTRAVQRQLVSDVPVGCFLSGGIDSSIIAAAMKMAAGGSQKILTYSIGFDDPRYDETQYAAAVAKHLGTEHRQFMVTPDAAEDLPRLAEVFGEPFGDSSALPTHYLSRETRGHVKVALSGDGGDELFGGYERYRAMNVALKLDKRRFISAVFGNPLWQSLPGTHPKSRSTRIKRFLRSLAHPPAERYAAYMALFEESELPLLFNDHWRQELSVPSLPAEFLSLLAGRDPVQAALALDRVTYLPGDLLTKVDRASMLHALEVRSPFMDPELVTFAASLTTDQLLRGGGKRMLREAFAADLPAFVFKRKKMGFAVPIGQWLRTSLREMFQDLVFSQNSFAARNFRMEFVRKIVDEHQAERVDHSQRLYAILMLELWGKTQ